MPMNVIIIGHIKLWQIGSQSVYGIFFTRRDCNGYRENRP